MIDLSNAINCINVQKENGTYDGQKIGRIAREFNGLVGRYNPGEVVLFREEEYGDTVTIERPKTQKEIDRQKAMSSLLTTDGTIVGVPRGYIEEIRFGAIRNLLKIFA